ncbi:MAG: CarD family transcriptional regulator [Planctomycetota bacterium]
MSLAEEIHEDVLRPMLHAGELPVTGELGKLIGLLEKQCNVSVGNLWAPRSPWCRCPARPRAAREGDRVRGGFERCRSRSVRPRLDGVWARKSAPTRPRPPTRPPSPAACIGLRTLSPAPAPCSSRRSWPCCNPCRRSNPSKEELTLRLGQELDVEPLLKRLVKLGYERTPLVEKPGEVSLRGDILDLFPFALEHPLRIELFDEEIESLRSFHPESQLSIDRLDAISVCLISDTGSVEEWGLTPLEFLPKDTRLVLVEPLRVEERGQALAIRSPAYERAWRTYGKQQENHRQLILQTLPGEHLSMDTRSTSGLEVGMEQAPMVLADEASRGARILIPCHSEGDQARLLEMLAGKLPPGTVETHVGTVSRGFRIPAWQLIVISHHELKGIQGTRRRVRKHAEHKVKAIHSFFELKLGDYVVHAVHGLAIYRGLKRMQRGGGEEEHLHLAFADEVSLFVPTSRIDMVQRYVGARHEGLKPDKIGGSAFRKRKEKVERGLFDMASDLIEVQAQRAMRTRDAWSGDPDLVASFENTFPYEPTPDQAKATADMAEDLTSPKPMDRMLCGDVGFGKTEMAVRAAFRVVAGGGQVAVLVPTTVLADQHYRTFAERMADFPVRVEVASRYVTGNKAKEVIQATAEGEVDILVGTHRILSKQVRFKNLGLVIIDEEQRFGVAHKEHFKRLRAEVDILTMTATPIPRTMHMSLAGLRDISALSTPPPGARRSKPSSGTAKTSRRSWRRWNGNWRAAGR